VPLSSDTTIGFGPVFDTAGHMGKVTRNDVQEPKVVALAEQLGRFLGRVAAKVDRRRVKARKATAKPLVKKAAAKKTMAPGKKHMKPPPPEAIDKRMGEPMGKQMGHKSVKSGMRRGRS
jgi:hypothetical protein